MITDINTAWDELRERVKACKRCGLCTTRKNTVFGEGPVNNCRCVIIGEAPGQDEDESGRPFVGPAGQLLTKILEDGGHIPRDSVYIMNVIKCRPPNNRDPNKGEMAACNDFLEAQLALLHPDIVVTLGNVPTKWLTHNDTGITRRHGRWEEWRRIRLFPMYHPSYLLRDNGFTNITELKRQTWQDVLNLKNELDKLQ